MATVLILSILMALRFCIPTAEQDRGRRPIEIRVTPQMCLQPCVTNVITRIEPHADNRWYVVQIDGPTFQSTARQINGATGRPTQEPIRFSHLVEGTYEVTAVVYRLSGEAGRSRQMVEVR